jgi:peptide/nickel transport system substrate-binding protein
VIQAPQWVSMLDQWDPKSPWHDRRVRLAANLAVDRKALNQAITLGHSKLTYSIIPSSFDYYWQPPAYEFDPAQAKKLLAEAGYPNGFDAGDYFIDVSYANVQEPIAGFLQQVGIRTKLISRERASHWSTYADKKYKNMAYTASGAFGNAATRIESYVVKDGTYVYGSYPDIDSLFKDQAAELDRKKREALLNKIQQLMREKVMHIPIWELAFINGQGPRVQESGLGLIPGHAYSAPYEDVKLKAK